VPRNERRFGFKAAGDLEQGCYVEPHLKFVCASWFSLGSLGGG
jgi:hypothetical protein